MDRKKIFWSASIVVLMLLCIGLSNIDGFFPYIFALPAMIYSSGWGVLSVLNIGNKLNRAEKNALSVGTSIFFTGFFYFIFIQINLDPFLFSSIVLYLIALFPLIKGYYPDWKISDIKTKIFIIKKVSAPILISTIIVLATVGVGVYLILEPSPVRPYTELYLLNSDGTAIDRYDINNGSNIDIIVGLVNHEKRTVVYHIQTWLVDVTFSENDNYSLSNMIFLDQIDVTLGHINVEIDDEWKPQWEYHYNTTINITGDFRLWFFLFKDDVPNELQGLISGKDYSSTDLVTMLDFSIDGYIQNVVVRVGVS